MKKNILKKIVIAHLADELQHLEEVSEWIWKEWSGKNGATLENEIYRSKHSLCKDRVPQMYIAKLDDKPVGVVSIWNNDLRSRQDLLPWLACLYVKEEYRGNGIGTILQKKAIEVVKELGYERLYLITNHENLYEKLEWKFLETAYYSKSEFVKIYEYQIK